MSAKRMRIYLTGVGGQGTLTATTLLAGIALDEGLDVTSGEIHGMAQRGGVVESTVLIGGWKSPSITHGEADLILGFEPMETLRALPYLAPGGVVLSGLDPVPSPGISAGREQYPDLEMIIKKTKAAASKAWFIPSRKLGLEAGSIQSGNLSLIGAMCAVEAGPFDLDALKRGIKKHLSPKLVEVNLKAVELGVLAVK